MAKILLGVSGGIAAYKALEFIRLATAAGHSVRVVQTPTSRRFVGEASFAALSGAPALTDEFEQDPSRGAFPGEELPSHQPLSHLELVANAEIYLVAPASANTLAKLAGGLADNLPTSCALAASCPVVVAPAMNNNMYMHPATQANISLLSSRGVHVIEPDSGRLASIGEHGVGRLAAPELLLKTCEEILLAKSAPSSRMTADPNAQLDFVGTRVLVTAGGTREPIDSVRFLGNSSSGRMGFALAAEALRRGAEVTLLAANTALEPPPGAVVHRVSSAADLKEACEREFPGCDVLLMAAAVADFRPLAKVSGKIKKGGREHLTIELEPTDDVISGLAGTRKPGQTLVAFAAEHGASALDYARAKLLSKRVDAVVYNDISRSDIGFEAQSNEVVIITGSGEQEIELAPKETIAARILDAVQQLRQTA